MEALLDHTPANHEGQRDLLEPEEAKRVFNDTAQHYLRISGDEFLKRWDAGYYTDPGERARAMRVALLIPLVRSVSARQNAH